jgi:PleD family two-component response regulator
MDLLILSILIIVSGRKKIFELSLGIEFANSQYDSRHYYTVARKEGAGTQKEVLTRLKIYTMLGKISVLILDDEKNSTEEIYEFLQKEGYNVFSAYSAKAGRTIIKRENIDVMILDIFLPDANGLDFLDKMRMEYPNTEVIMISGQGDVDSIIRSIRLGVVDFLRKPLRQIDLSSALARTKKIQKSCKITDWLEKQQMAGSGCPEMIQGSSC